MIECEANVYFFSNGTGFKVVSDIAHKFGLKFGIHVMRGIYSEVVAENQPVCISLFLNALRRT